MFNLMFLPNRYVPKPMHYDEIIIKQYLYLAKYKENKDD